MTVVGLPGAPRGTESRFKDGSGLAGSGGVGSVGPRPGPAHWAVLAETPPLEGTSGAAEFRVGLQLRVDVVSGGAGSPMNAAPLVGYSSSGSEDEDEDEAGARAPPEAEDSSR